MKVNKCFLCNSDRYKSLYIKNKLTIVQCTNCEFVYVLENISKNIIDKYYNSFDYKSIIIAEHTIRKDARRSCSVIDKFIGFRSSLIDIGCGRGFFLEEAKNNGWVVSGIDASTPMVNYARKRLHLNVQRGDIMNYESNDKYNLVTLHQVIEHFNDPINLLKKCNKLLNKGGYIYIATPNINSLSSKVQKERFDHLIPPEHLSYFSPKTLKKALEVSGFRFRYSSFWSYPADLGGIIKTLMRKQTFINESCISKDISPDSNNTQVHLVKKIKSLLFDNFFCELFYSILNYDSWGTNLEILAQKL